jgi:hypothetical protein
MIVNLLFYADEKRLAELSRAERNALVERHVQYGSEVLPTICEIIDSRALLPTATALTVRREGGEAYTAPGPFDQPRLGLTGWYLVDCADLEQACGR